MFKEKMNKKYIFPILGILLVILGNLPFFILREKISISVREQFDGEILAYILGEKHLFDRTGFYPEFMGGMSSESLTPPSYAMLLLFKAFSPLYAYIINQFIMMLFGFMGMYLWGLKISGKRFVSFCAAVLFAFLPYYTMYGLCVSGIPFVFWAFFNLKDEEKEQNITKQVINYLIIAIYGFGSSLILCGFAICACFGVLLIMTIVKAPKKKSSGSIIIRQLTGFLELVFIYMLMNRKLIHQILRPEKYYVSHKLEIVQAAKEFWSSFAELFIKGSVAVPSLHFFIATVALIVILTGGLVLVINTIVSKDKKTDINNKDVIENHCINTETKRIYIRLTEYVILAAGIALFSSFWHSPFVINRLNSMDSAVKAFQIDRFYWMYPFIWYSVLILLGALAESVLKKHKIGVVLWLLLLLPCSVYVLKESAFKENALEFVRKNSTALTWEAYFCEKEFKDIADYIENNEGLKQNEYRVGSLGIEPAVAVYNGFYSIDGYSNNYDLDYKHRFRKVIEKELEKNEYNREYFDDWGNRCYLYSSEYFHNPLLTKYEHASFNNLELDTEALKEIGCRYIFAAGEIVNAERKGYRLVKIFDGYDYTYFIYLYEVL